MLILRIVLVAAAAIMAGVIAVRAGGEAASQQAGSPFGDPSAASGVGADRDPIGTSDPDSNAGGPGSSEDSSPVTTGLSSELRAALEDDIRTWQFSPDRDPKPLAVILERTVVADERTLLRDWFLRRALHRASADVDPIPAKVHRIELKSGRTVFARESTRTREGVRVTTLTGIEATFPTAEVRAEEVIGRDTYLRQASPAYRTQLAELDPTRAGDLESGIRHALRRGDLAEANRLFTRWLDTDGPHRLGRRTPRGEVGLRLATRLASPRDPTSTATAANEPRTRPSPPSSFDELSERIDGVYRRFREEKLTKADRQTYLAEITQWEEWLERTVIELDTPPSNLNDLRLRLQHLRLDMLKSGGF